MSFRTALLGNRGTCLAALAMLGIAGQAHASVYTVNGETSDAEVTKSTVGDGGGTVGNQSKAGTGAILCGQYNTTPDAICNVFVFQLPSLNAGETISSVNFRVNGYKTGTVAFSGDLYGLGARAANTVLSGDYYTGATGGDATDATLIQGGAFTTSTSTANTTIDNFSNATFATYVQTQYTNAGAGNYIFLRFSPNFTSVPTNSSVNGYTVTPADGASASVIPQLTINTVPEPTAGAALIGMAGLGLLRRRRAR